MLDVRLLGTFEVRENKKTVNLPSRPAQSLFAYLILSAGTSHRREKLAGILWPDSREEAARDNLRHALWKIRKTLPPSPKPEYLHVDDIAIAFNASSEYWLDAAALKEAGEDASADELITALSVYRGELLPGFYDEWALLEREHLNSVFEHKMARLMSLLQDECRWLDILDWGERWLKLGHKPEPAYQALMSAHAAKGDMSKVAATYERCVTSLKESGIEPSGQTKELYERLKEGKMPLESGSTLLSREKRKESLKTNLPVPITSFIGRGKEVAEILQMLGENRLVTLTGPGGVGKTRLAIESSKQSINKFSHGVWWVELAPLSEGALVIQAAAQAMDVRELRGESLTETLKNYLRGKQSLLVLDNCEHLIENCARLADDLLTHCADLKILTTSREGLGITGEAMYQVPSLSLPAPEKVAATDLLIEYGGVRLFVERARGVKPDFVLTEQNTPAVLQICMRLDGIPLALELAAARIRLLTAEHIAERLNDRFNLLMQGSRTALPRHQTLRAAIDWSYDLLPEGARILFRRLSVFPRDFTLEAAEEVCSEPPLDSSTIFDLLEQLVDRSLVKAGRGENVGRYSLSETIQEYARGKLDAFGEKDMIHDRHLSFFAHFAERAESNFMTSASSNWHSLLESEFDNLRNAMKWSVVTESTKTAGDEHPRLQDGLRLAGALYWIWDDRDFPNETSIWVQDVVSRSKLPTAYRARALMSLGVLRATLNNFAKARICFEEALAICRDLGSPFLLAQSLTYRGAIDEAEADYISAQAFLKKGLEIAEELNLVPLIGWILSLLADTILMQGDAGRARELYEKSAGIFRDIRHRDLLAYQLRRLGYLAMSEGRFAEASQGFRRSLEMNHATQFQYGIIASLTSYARLALAENKIGRSAQLYGALDTQLGLVSYRLYLLDEVEFERGKIALDAKLDGLTAADFWNTGSAMTLEQAIEFALDEVSS